MEDGGDVDVEVCGGEGEDDERDEDHEDDRLYVHSNIEL